MCCAEHLDDAFEVVSHDGDAEFGLRTGQASQQQTRMTEDTVFDCSEGMLDRRSSETHGRWRRTLVRPVKCVVIDGT